MAHQPMIRAGAQSRSSGDALALHADPVDARPRRDIERLAVGIAELHIAAKLRQPDRAKMLARGRNDPDAARARLPEIALHVDAQAISDPAGRIAVDVDQQPAVLERAVGIDVVSPDKT